MKRLIATSVAFAGMTATALGADLGAPVEMPWTWAGPYVGLHAGFGWSNEFDCIPKKRTKEKSDHKNEENGGHKIKTASAGPEGGSGSGVFIVDGKIVQSSEAEAGPEGAEATAERDDDNHREDHDGHSGDQEFAALNCGPAVPNGSADAEGFMGGGQIGYNFQFHQFVLGIEGDMSLTDWNGSGAFGLQRDINWFGTVRGRLGYAWQRTMPYVTGGLAVADVDFSAPFVDSSSETMTGWTVGGGVELAVSDSVSVRGEYLHFDLSDIDGDIVRAGVNFRFWTPQPKPVYVGY